MVHVKIAINVRVLVGVFGETAVGWRLSRPSDLVSCREGICDGANVVRQLTA